MPVNPFSFLAQAIGDLLNANLGLFEAMGLTLFRGLAVILLAWFGIKAALSSAQGGPGFNLAKFADLLLLISFGLARRPTTAPRYRDLGSASVTSLPEKPSYSRTRSRATRPTKSQMPLRPQRSSWEVRPESFIHEALTFFAVYIALAIAQGVAFAVIAYGLVATAVCVLIGPIFVPFLIVPKLDWLFWGWFKAFIGFAFTKWWPRLSCSSLPRCSWDCLPSSAHCGFQMPT